MIAAMFPGQGSQKPGMGADFFESDAGHEVVTRIHSATGADIRALCLNTDEDALRQTQNAQMALYACGVAAYKSLVAAGGPIPKVFAGHSIGEYAALAAAEWISIEDGARLVARRGELMASAGSDRAGTMAAVLGLERDALEAVCRDASTNSEVAVVANDNCPGQLVISGDVEAVRRAGNLAGAAGAKRVLPLNVSGAFHSPLMESSSRAMGAFLRDVNFVRGIAPVVSNVSAQPINDEGLWPGLLEMQLKSPVRWTESVQAMVAAGIDTFIECGAGEVLCGLVRRTNKDVRTLAVTGTTSLAKSLAELGVAV